MKLDTIFGLTAFAALVTAGTKEEIELFTAVVSDYSSRKGQYIDYFMTVRSVPSGLTQLVLKVATYTDDSYTSLIGDSSIDIVPLVSFVTELPWYTRIEAAQVTGGETSGVTSTADTILISSSSSDQGISPSVPIGALVGVVALILM
ncbi:hypothetical protein JCM33374_g2426 [Metschnikowia sp. JCM 33374]|nr:hypothetical protein JCM33374_g2426 [Metschnikowia sp. JCM 33374]